MNQPLQTAARKAEDLVEEVEERAQEEADAYRGNEPRPLGSLLKIIATYLTLVGTVGVLAFRRGRWPARLPAADLALGVVAVHRASMLLSKDTVAAPLRAPFTTFEGPAGEGQLNESVRGTGLRKAIGELLTCPFCLAHWFATFWAIGYLFAPGATRAASASLSVATGAQWLHRLDARMR